MTNPRSALRCRCHANTFLQGKGSKGSDGAWEVFITRVHSAPDCNSLWPAQDAPMVRMENLTWKDAIDALRAGELGQILDEQLLNSPHWPNLYWETPPLSRQARTDLSSFFAVVFSNS